MGLQFTGNIYFIDFSVMCNMAKGMPRKNDLDGRDVASIFTASLNRITQMKTFPILHYRCKLRVRLAARSKAMKQDRAS